MPWEYRSNPRPAMTPQEIEQRRAEAALANRCTQIGCHRPMSTKYTAPLCDKHALDVWAQVQAEQDAILERHDLDLIEQKRAATREERLNRPGSIYYIRIGEHIKVGYAKNLDSRLAAYPPTATLLATHPGTRKDEQAIHSLFTVHRRAGREWYDPAPELMAHIDKVIAEHGAPKVDPFTRRLAKPPKSQPVQMRRRSGPSGYRVA